MADISTYIGNRDLFPVLNKWDFFNHAGVAPLPAPAADAIRAYSSEAELGAYLETTWHHDIEKLRILSASLINAHRDEIALVKNTSEGISIVARGIEWQWGDVIVTTNAEYPANIYPWLEIVRSRGARLVQVPEETDSSGARRVPFEKILQAAEHEQCKLVALSHVEYASGQRHDLRRVGEFCRSRNILFSVDAIQSLGMIPVDVQAMKIDYLSADGHKWLLGPEGAGIFYCRRELIERTRPLMIGWMNVINAQDYGDFDYTLRADAGRFECGSHNIAGFLGLKASMEMLLEIGIERVFDRIKLLTDRLIQGVELKGYRVVSPRDIGHWSGVVSFVSEKLNHEDIFRALRKNHRVEIAVREGRLRVSAHFYNTTEQIDRLIDLLPPSA